MNIIFSPFYLATMPTVHQHLDSSCLKSNHPLKNGCKDNWTWNLEVDYPSIQFIGVAEFFFRGSGLGLKSDFQRGEVLG